MRRSLDNDVAEMEIPEGWRGLVLLDARRAVRSRVEHANVNSCIRDVLQYNV